jgi:Ca2+-binding EF-hand superfamily protein
MGPEGSAAHRRHKGKEPKIRDPTSQEYARLAIETKFTIPELKQLWVKFRSLSGTQVADGKIDIQEFSAALGMTGDSFAQRIFSAFDGDASQEIDFAEFVHGLHAMSSRATLDEKAKFCFKVYDADGNGEIDRQELRTILMHSLRANARGKMTEEQMLQLVDRAYDRMDRNGDGGISFTEFRNEAAKNPTIISCVNLNIDTILGQPEG